MRDARAVVGALPLIAACGRWGFGDDGGGGELPDGALVDPYAAAVLTDGPLAFIRFDETAGPTVGSLVGGISGTYDGVIAFDQPGVVPGNGSVELDGTSSRISLGDVFAFPGVSPYTFEIWTRPTVIDDTRFVFDRRTLAGVAEGYSCYFGAGYYLFARVAAGSETGYVNAPTIPVDSWVHTVITFDGAVQRLYIHGSEVALNVGAGTPIGQGAGEFVLGDSQQNQFKKFQGRLDELAVYERALTPAEIAAHRAAAQR